MAGNVHRKIVRRFTSERVKTASLFGAPVTLILFPNLFFEEELSREPSASKSLSNSTARRLVKELSPVMGLIADVSEKAILLVDSDSVPADLPPSLAHVEFATIDIARERVASDPNSRFRSWGWSQHASDLGLQIGVKCFGPSIDVVRDINSREFLVPHDFVVDLKAIQKRSNDQFSRLCRCFDQVENQLRAWQKGGIDSWVIKANLSQAARNRIIGRGALLSEPHRRWVEKQIESHDCVALEPWVERIAECGLQFTIFPSTKKTDLTMTDADVGPSTIGGPKSAARLRSSESAHVAFDGVAEMLTDSSGRYCGSWINNNEPPEWTLVAIDHCRQLAEMAAGIGYFGPIGFDCMLFRNPGSSEIGVRLCHDVNARNTMGRVALSLRRFLDSGEHGLWLHANDSRWTAAVQSPISGAEQPNAFNEATGLGVRIVPTSPTRIGSQPTQLKTALLISTDRMKLRTVADRILWQTSGS